MILIEHIRFPWQSWEYNSPGTVILESVKILSNQSTHTACPHTSGTHTKNGMMCTKGIRDWGSIDTLDWYPQLTSRSVLDGHRNQLGPHLINSRLIVGWVSTDSYEMIEKFVDFRPTVDWDVDGVSTEVLIECLLRVDQGYRLKVSILLTLDHGCL